MLWLLSQQFEESATTISILQSDDRAIHRNYSTLNRQKLKTIQKNISWEIQAQRRCSKNAFLLIFRSLQKQKSSKTRRYSSILLQISCCEQQFNQEK